MARTYRKLRISRWRTYDDRRWGAGAVHLYAYSTTDPHDPRLAETKKSWQLGCLRWTHGEEIEDRTDPTPVTCTRCLASGFVPPDWQPKDTPAGTRRARGVNENKENDMALRGASTVVVDQDWLDFKVLAAESAAVLLTVKEIEPEEKFSNSTFSPVRARVVILTGAQAGRVYDNERILAAGIRNKLTEVGADVVGRIKFYGARKNPGLEAEHPGDIELAEAALAKFGASVPDQRSDSDGPVGASGRDSDDDAPPF